MKYLLATLVLASAASALNCTNRTLTQDFDERFAIYTDLCEFLGCSEDLTHPVDGLSWTNVHSVQRPGIVDFTHPGGQLPPYVITPSGQVGFPLGLYTGEAINASVPTTATSKYNGSCVRNWELNRITFGCNFYAIDGSSGGPRDCNITVEGFDASGQCVGHEKYFYHGVVINTGFPNYWLETDYNTTAGGLKGKKLQKISILADIPHDPSTETTELGIGEVLYTVHNSTSRCACPSGGSNSTSGGSNSTFRAR